jgi:uncharacterized protein with GYD domain
MPTYIQLIKWTQKGIETVKDAPQRTERAHEMIKSVGGEQKVYFTFGRYDIIVIVEAPNDETMAKLALGMGRGGNSSVETLKAFTEEEGLAIIKGLL